MTVDVCALGMADLVITAANVLASAAASKEIGTAGANITAGQPLYKDATDSNKLKLGQATTSAKSAFAGISLHAAATGQPVQYVIADDDFTTGNATMTIGEVYTLSATAGSLCPAADITTGNFTTVAMVASSATKAKVLAHANLRAGAAKV